MKDENTIKQYIKILRPMAKFIDYKYSNDFIEKTENLENNFHYINLYDEKIDSNVLRLNNNEMIIIHNTYLSSFAYNLFICWIYPTFVKEINPDEINNLVRYNFKKYYAEQLLRRKNYLFSRAILLETLLYEQQMMVPLFRMRDGSNEMDSKAAFGSSIMSSLISHHELGHYHLAKTPELWDEVFAKYSDSLEDTYLPLLEKFTMEFIEEIQCDVISIALCFEQFNKEYGKGFCLRVIIFAFASFTVLSSLDKSAEATIKEIRDIDVVNFKDVKKVERNFNYKLGTDYDFHQRALFACSFCEAIAQQNKLDLYTSNNDFSLPENIIDELLSHLDKLMETSRENDRGMAMLVAESLHNHPQGMEYLYLRSKSFITNRVNFDYNL